MATTTFTMSALASEFQIDPLSLGYAPLITAGDQNGLADAVNVKRPGGAYQVDHDPVTAEEVFTYLPYN